MKNLTLTEILLVNTFTREFPALQTLTPEQVLKYLQTNICFGSQEKYYNLINQAASISFATSKN
jgi:hypothetical protein